MKCLVMALCLCAIRILYAHASSRGRKCGVSRAAGARDIMIPLALSLERELSLSLERERTVLSRERVLYYSLARESSLPAGLM